MRVPKDFTKDVFALLHDRLGALGFRKRKPQVVSLLVDEGVLGLIGLNKATGRGAGILEINPVIGIRNQTIERMVSGCLGEPFDELNPFT